MRPVERLLDQDGHGLVIEDGFAVHHAVMAVAGVRVERDIGDHADLRDRGLDRANGAADQIGVVQRFRAIGVAQLRLGVGKKRPRPEFPVRRPFARRRRRGRSTAVRRPAWRLSAWRCSRPRQRNSRASLRAHPSPFLHRESASSEAGLTQTYNSTSRVPEKLYPRSARSVRARLESCL